MTDIIEGESREVAVIERLSERTPAGTVELATSMATVLADIVEKKGLYANIKGKRYPTVEAWMTIARMDNVVAREEGNPVRHEDGSYEAAVELIRLSDGMVVGRGSALCGTKGDAPWDTRTEPARRSMAVTRATSRAFRQQYSWIMALAGYEPTPAEEMPNEQRPVGAYDEPPNRPELQREVDGLIGTVAAGKPPVDMEARQTPDGPAWGFKLTVGRKGYQALAVGPLAQSLSVLGIEVGTRVQAWGEIVMVPWSKTVDGQEKAMPPFARVNLERIKGDDFDLPAPEEAESQPLWSDTPDAEERAAILAYETSEAAK